MNSDHWLNCRATGIPQVLLGEATPAGPCNCREIVEGMQVAALPEHLENAVRRLREWKARELKRLDELGR